MIAHVNGKITFRSPTYIVIDCHGVGYGIQISLNTYGKLGNAPEAMLLTHLAVKEDSHTLFGFADEEERQLFLNLISVSGVGANTARMILSSLKTGEIIQAISTGNWALLKSVKGIGPKTAQRIVIDLQDKIKQAGMEMPSSAGWQAPDAGVSEALTALMMLGFGKNEAEKGLMKIRQQNPEFTVEQLVKNTLKIL